jgi:hypothetical protein
MQNQRSVVPVVEIMSEYYYLGDRQTSAEWKGAPCRAVRRQDGKCIRGKNGSMLVEFEFGKSVVMGRLLRKVKTV